MYMRKSALGNSPGINERSRDNVFSVLRELPDSSWYYREMLMESSWEIYLGEWIVFGIPVHGWLQLPINRKCRVAVVSFS